MSGSSWTDQIYPILTDMIENAEVEAGFQEMCLTDIDRDLPLFTIEIVNIFC